MNLQLEKLEEISLTGVEKRFVKKINMPGHFSKCLDSLMTHNKIMLVTGFCIKSVMTGETDGPIGTVCLARALEKLGKEVIIVTDDYSKKYVEIGLSHYQSKVELLSVPLNFSMKDSEILIEKYDPEILFFIERPSKNRSGQFNSMSGEALLGFIPDTDFLYESGKKRNIPIMALGDGGNETGMGLLRSHIEAYVALGSQICAETRADVLIVSGVSNWGCYTLVGGLSLMSHERLIPTVDEEVEHLRLIVEAGAVDGVSKKAEMSVDGYTLEENLQVLKKVNHVYNHFLR